MARHNAALEGGAICLTVSMSGMINCLWALLVECISAELDQYGPAASLLMHRRLSQSYPSTEQLQSCGSYSSAASCTLYVQESIC